MDPKWYNVNEDARVWAGHSDAHKMGWMRAGSAIRAVEEYKSSYRFEEYKPPADLKELGGGYNEYWIRKADVTVEPMPDDDGNGDTDTLPSQPGDAELGAALRILINFIRTELLGR
jgi:hypothetical protein